MIADGLSEVLDDLSDAIFTEMTQWGDNTLEESQEQVPVDTGTLKDSGFIAADRQTKTVTVGYAGPFGGTNPKSGQHVNEYAVTVHEELVPHKHGKAKFLEDPAMQEFESFVASIGSDLV